MASRESIQAEVFAPGAPQHTAPPETQKHAGWPDWRVLASGALVVGLAIGWALGSTSNITREAEADVEVAKPIEIPEPDTLSAPAITWQRSAVVPTPDIGKLDRQVVLTSDGGLVPLHGPSPATGSEIVWTFEGSSAVATRWDGQSPFGFMDGDLLGIGESAILAYDVTDLTQRPNHVLALQPELTVVRAQNDTGLWIQREDQSLRYFDMVNKRFLTTYAQTAEIPHLHGMTSTMLLWNDEDTPQAMPYDLSTLSPDGEVVPIDLTGREDLPVRGYSGNAIVFGGVGSESDLYFPDDQTWLTVEFSAGGEGLALNAVVSPDRRNVVIVFSSEVPAADYGSGGVKAVLKDVASGETLLVFALHNPAELPIHWLDDSRLLWVGQRGVEAIALGMFDIASGEQHVLANLSGSDWRLLVEPIS